MKSEMFVIGIGLAIISIIIYLVKNFKELSLFINKIKERKITAIIYKILIIVVICCIIYYIYNLCLQLIKSIEITNLARENDVVNEYNDKRIFDEWNIYRTAINKQYEKNIYEKPYIPEGFSYVEGAWNTGFVIQDEMQNQYVWVPCTNEENHEITKLERKNFSKEPFISKDICINEGCEKFISSTLENGGFYISRYEIGKENNLPVSKAGVKIFGNITREEAKQVVSKMNKNVNLQCELINGYAYDTTLSWLKTTNDIKVNEVDNKNDLKTGRFQYNNIYDFIDNILEITAESSYGTVIVRGFLFDMEESMGNNILLESTGYNNNSFDRISIREEDNYYTPEHIMGFRTVLYK